MEDTTYSITWCTSLFFVTAYFSCRSDLSNPIKSCVICSFIRAWKEEKERNKAMEGVRKEGGEKKMDVKEEYWKVGSHEWGKMRSEVSYLITGKIRGH